jgi:hypothetical protein
MASDQATVLALRRASDRQRNNARKAERLRELTQAKLAEHAALPPHKLPAERRCLGCGKLFGSKHVFNRMCGNCKETL